MTDYYGFDGVQVLDISRHLTSNSGQAVQYIARSSRLDGKNKGDRVGDLHKALDFIQDEITRLEWDGDEVVEAYLDALPPGARIITDDDCVWEKSCHDSWARTLCGGAVYVNNAAIARRGLLYPEVLGEGGLSLRPPGTRVIDQNGVMWTKMQPGKWSTGGLVVGQVELAHYRPRGVRID